MGQLLDAMQPHILIKLGQYTGQHLATSCWSLAVLWLSSHPAMKDLMQVANSHQQEQAGAYS